MTDTQKAASFGATITGALPNTPDKQERLRAATLDYVRAIQGMSDDEPFNVPGLAPLSLNLNADFSGWNGAGLALGSGDIPQYRHDATDAPDAPPAGPDSSGN